MPVKISCPTCGVFNPLFADRCGKCGRPITEEEKYLAKRQANLSQEEIESLEEPNDEELEQLIKDAEAVGGLDALPKAALRKLSRNIVLTTSFFVANAKIEKELDIVTSQVVYGVNVIRDLFVEMTDFWGGRSGALQKVLKGGRNFVLHELRKEAFLIGADGVIGVAFNYQEISGGKKSGMIMMVASGTAVKLKKK